MSTVFRLIQYKREGKQLHFHISRHIAHLGWETPVFFTLFTLYTYGTVVSNFLRHLPNCPCSNFSRYVDLFQEMSPRITKLLCYSRRDFLGCKNSNCNLLCSEFFFCKFGNILPGMRRKVNISTLMNQRREEEYTGPLRRGVGGQPGRRPGALSLNK